MNRIAAITGGLAGLAGLLALGACGSGAEGGDSAGSPEGVSTMTIDTGEGAVNIVSGANRNIELPPGFSLYPGAAVIASSTVSHEQGSGARVIMSTPASPVQVVEYYRKQARDAGIIDLTEIAGGNQVMMGGKGEDGTDFTLTAARGEGTTTVTLLVATGF